MSPIPMFYGIGVKTVTAQNQDELADQRVASLIFSQKNTWLYSGCVCVVF